MKTFPESYKHQATDYVNRHQPNSTESSCCSSITPALTARFLIRTAIPIILGLLSGVIIEAQERKAGIHNDDDLLEISDCISCTTTLLITYSVNALLNCCWPKNPYNKHDFFQSPTHHTNSSTAYQEVQSYNA